MHRRILRPPVILTVIAPTLLFSPLIITGKALFWGTPATQFIPWWSLAWENLRQGSAPLWNPYSGMGAPLLANYQSAIFYPPNWLYFLLDSFGGIKWMAWAQAIVVTAHLIWSGVGMISFIRRLGLGEISQTISGLAYGLSGYLVARAGFLSINAATAWLPWVMLGVTDVIRVYIPDTHRMIPLKGDDPEKAPRSIRLKKVSWLTLYLGLLLLAGHAQTAWYIMILASSWSIYLLLSSGHFRFAIRALLALILAATLALCLAAIQLAPTAEYLLQSQRASEVEYDFAMSYSFWPWHFLTLIAPGLFGNPAHSNYWGFGNYWEDAVYIGLLPFFLAISGMASWIIGMRKGAQRSPMVFFTVVTLAAFLLALGKNTPVFPWLFKNIPTFDMFQAPTRFTLLSVFSLAVLAAYGAENWHRPSGRSLYWTKLSLMGSVAVMVGSVLAGWLFRDAGLDVRPSLITASLIAGLWGFGSVLLTLYAPDPAVGSSQRNTYQRWYWAAGVWVAADLIIAGWGLNPGISLDFYTKNNFSIEANKSAVSKGRLYIEKQDEEFLKFDRFFRFDTFYPFTGGGSWDELRESLLPNLNILDRVYSVNNFDPLVPYRYVQWMTVLDSSEGALKENLLRLMNVSLIEQVINNEEYEIKFLPFISSPRIRWMPCSIFVETGDEALQKMTQAGFDFDRVVVLENPAPQTMSNCSGNGESKLSIMKEDSRYLKVKLETNQDGYLFIADLWYPGWQAVVDGQLVEILRSNYLFRAIPVFAGAHEIEMVYRPKVYYLGAGISGLTCVLLVFVMFLGVRHDKIPR